jgi:hypothetical protein
MVELTLPELELLFRKYVSEKTPIVAFLMQGKTRVKFSGVIDSVSESGLVVRNENGDFAIFDVSAMQRSLLGDRRDIPAEAAEVETDYTSALSLVRQEGEILTIFER